MIDCVVAGAGPSGLAVSAALSDHDVDHVVLERDRVGQSWRTQRWNSLRLNNPGWMNPMLGPQERDTYFDRSRGGRAVGQVRRIPARARADQRGCV